MTCRPALPADADAIARIYNQGIEDRSATFETRPRAAPDVLPWLEGLPRAIVAEIGGRVVAFAATSAYSSRDCYEGVREVSIYVDRAARGRGAGRAVGEALVRAAEDAGCWKLVSKIFVENAASRRLVRSLGFREVGVHERHARLDGRWRDVVVVERLLGGARDGTP